VSAVSVDLPELVVQHRRSARRSRTTLLFAVVIVTSVTAFALALVSHVWPIGGGGDQPKYVDLASQRTYVFVFFALAGIQLVLGVCAAALLGLVLAPRRGATLATVGAGLLFCGAAAYGVGIGGWASGYWFATDTRALPAATAAALVDDMNHDTIHMLLIPLAGAVVVGIGSLVLLAGIWRAGTVPTWLLAVSVASTVATFLLPPAALAGVAAEATSSIATIALAWYAVRLVMNEEKRN
jgi:hypothetical protein